MYYITESALATRDSGSQAQDVLVIWIIRSGKDTSRTAYPSFFVTDDLDMLETAMEDADLANRYFLNMVTGEVIFFSDYLGLSDEDERLVEEIDGSNDYVALERVPSHVAYQWMVDFVDEMVAPADEHAAEQLSMALNGKGAFHRFKETLHRVDEQWLQAWYQWRNKQL